MNRSSLCQVVDIIEGDLDEGMRYFKMTDYVSQKHQLLCGSLTLDDQLLKRFAILNHDTVDLSSATFPFEKCL